MDTDYYRVLGVSEDAEPEVIEAAFKALAKKYHPDIWRGDKAFATEKLKNLNVARDILRDTEKRAAYDRKNEKGSETQSTKSKKQSADKGPWETPKSEKPRYEKGPWETPKSEKPRYEKGPWDASSKDKARGKSRSGQKPSYASKMSMGYWVKLSKNALTSTRAPWIILLILILLGVVLRSIVQDEKSTLLLLVDLSVGLTFWGIVIQKVFFQRSKVWIVAFCLLISGLFIHYLFFPFS